MICRDFVESLHTALQDNHLADVSHIPLPTKGLVDDLTGGLELFSNGRRKHFTGFTLLMGGSSGRLITR